MGLYTRGSYTHLNDA